MPTITMQQPPTIIGFERERYASPEMETSSPKDASSNDDDTMDVKVPPREEPRRHPTIRFNVRVAVKETIHRHDYTADEVARTWYKKSDFVTMKHAFTAVVQLYASGRYPGDDDDMTIRGLEYRHRDGAMRRKRNKLNALYAVLDEQERQWRDGYDCDEDIRAVYLVNSSNCCHAAHAIGKQDEMECMRINGNHQAEEDETMSISSDPSCDEHGVRADPFHRKTSGFSRFFHKERNHPRSTG